MGDLDEIKKLMEHLVKSEKDKEIASQKMKDILEKSINEIKNILLSLKKYIAKDNIILKSYSGKTFEVGEGIIVFDKAIDEKLVLKSDNFFYFLKIENDKLIEKAITDLEINNYINYDTLFENVKNSLIKCIQKNENDIRIYKSTMFKIDKYNKELAEILSLKNSIQNEKL
ncbi:MAG: hypothetical protein ACPL3A_02395 [Thermoanaerobacteraceae bacterium]